MPADHQIRDVLDEHFANALDVDAIDVVADVQAGAGIGRRRVQRRRVLAGVAGLALAVGSIGVTGLRNGNDRTTDEIAQAQQLEIEAEAAILLERRTQRGDALGLDPRSYFYDYVQDASSVIGLPAPRSEIVFSRSGIDRGSGVLPETPTYMFSITGGLGRTLPPYVSPSEANTFTVAIGAGGQDPADQPQSTFGLDVDTASYNVAQTWIRDEAAFPPVGSVRIEELVNYFDYGYPDPTARLGLTVDGALVDEDENLHVVRVGVATERVTLEERKPVAVTFVIDVSGSMGIRERLGLVQSSLALLVLELDEADTVAIVTYDNDGTVLLEPTPISDGTAIVAAIDQLKSGGSTNLEGGLRTGYRLATEAFREDANNLVVLASDGVANVGLTDSGSIVEAIEAEANDGINLVTVGYGMGNFNDTMMEQLANSGDGFYAYLDDYDEAVHLFRDELSQLLVPVARDAKAQVTFDPEFVESYRLLGYENRELNTGDFRDDSVDAGELGSGHAATALYEVRLTDEAMSNDVVAGTAAVRWQDPITGEVSEVSRPIQTGDLASSVDEASASFQLANTVADFARALRARAGDPDVPFTGDDDHTPDLLLGRALAGELRSFDMLAADAERLGEQLDDPLVREFAALVQRAAELER